jgi:23S rRNA (adenine2503-C2)-methyltransferase
MTPGGDEYVQLLDASGSQTKRPLFGLSNEQLADAMRTFGQPVYRVKQLSEALYRQWNTHFDDISTLPKDLRQALIEAGFVVGLPEIAETFRSSDGTERYLVACGDKQTVETVWMPGGDGGEEGDGSEEAENLRATICVSSQIGCAVNCQFCLTARLGLLRNLTAGEIAGQVVAVLKRQKARIGRDRINLVFMGMGEAFLNYDAFMDAVRLLVNEVGIAESRMTVSTSGIVPGIERFGTEKVRPKLAISLNASNNAVREQIMPVTRKWSIQDILEAVRSIPLRAKERVTFEYVLLGGVNDRPEHADEVAALIRRANIPAKVNLIVWNPGPGVDFHMPLDEDVARFQSRLMLGEIPAFVRRPRGRDIYAACGQLKRTLSAAG